MFRLSAVCSGLPGLPHSVRVDLNPNHVVSIPRTLLRRNNKVVISDFREVSYVPMRVYDLAVIGLRGQHCCDLEDTLRAIGPS